MTRGLGGHVLPSVLHAGRKAIERTATLSTAVFGGHVEPSALVAQDLVERAATVGLLQESSGPNIVTLPARTTVITFAADTPVAPILSVTDRSAAVHSPLYPSSPALGLSNPTPSNAAHPFTPPTASAPIPYWHSSCSPLFN